MKHIDDVVQFLQPLMKGFDASWGVAGGWAIDLFLGKVTRPHADIELAIFRQDQAMLHCQFPGWDFEKIVNGRSEIWNRADWLSLPIHEIHARSKDKRVRAIELLLNESDDHHWIFRRNPAITLPRDRAIFRSGSGLPLLTPEIVLLFKAKSPRTKDGHDFESAREVIEEPRKQWLRESLAICYPRHPWIKLLGGSISRDQ